MSSLLSEHTLLDENEVVRALVVQPSLPLLDTQNGNIFKDRNDPNLIWFLPSFTLMEDPDGDFMFEASQTGTDAHGNPFNTCHLKLGLKKVIPDDVMAWRAHNASAQLMEIQISERVSIGVVVRDVGGDRSIIWQCSVAHNADSTMVLSIDNILGDQVIVLYENLVNEDGATLSIMGAYEGWESEDIILWRGGRYMRVYTGAHLPDINPRSAAINNMVERHNVNTNSVDLGSVHVALAVLNHSTIIPPVAEFPLVPHTPVLLERVSEPFTMKVPIARKFAADPYQLKFTIATGGVTRPIINVSDLQSYDVRQSEFTELTLLGNVNARYPSIDRLYLGVLSRTIMIIPSQYVILRQSDSCAAVCNAVVDSSPGLNAGCRFQFEFTLVPDVNPVDLVQLSQDLAGHPETKNCTLSMPGQIKDGSTSTLTSPFVTSFSYSKGSFDSHSFLLSAVIKEVAGGVPAVANANMLIDQLCSVREPFLSGILNIKLDDVFATPIEVPVTLNFKKTNGITSIVTSVDEPSNTLTLTNVGLYDLNVSRGALVTPRNVTLVPIGRTISSGQTVSLPLPLDHTDLTVLVDSELTIVDTISKSDLFKYLQIKTVDVQNTQYSLGINGTAINFDNRGIDSIGIHISLRDLPDITVPSLTLLGLHRYDNTHIVIPLDHAMGLLMGTILCTIHFTDPARASTTFTMENDFVRFPIFVLKDSDLVI